MQGGAGEGDVGNVSHALVRHLGRDEVGAASGNHLPRFVKVQQGAAEAVHVAVAAVEHAVVEEQPAFGGLDGHGTGANLHALPGAKFEGGGCHYVAVVSPELHVRRFAVEDVSEGGVAGVGGAGEHGVSAINLTGEEHAVAVVGQEGVLHLVEGLEIFRPGQADGGAVIAVAPAHPVLAVDEGYAGVVAVHPLGHFGVGSFEADGIGLDVPVDAVFGEAGMEGHAAVGVVAAEYAGKAVFKGYDGAVENAVGVLQQVPGNHGIGAVSPEGGLAALRAVFPRHVGKRFSFNDYFTHS